MAFNFGGVFGSAPSAGGGESDYGWQLPGLYGARRKRAARTDLNAGAVAGQVGATPAGYQIGLAPLPATSTLQPVGDTGLQANYVGGVLTPDQVVSNIAAEDTGVAQNPYYANGGRPSLRDLLSAAPGVSPMQQLANFLRFRRFRK